MGDGVGAWCADGVGMALQWSGEMVEPPVVVGRSRRKFPQRATFLLWRPLRRRSGHAYNSDMTDWTPEEFEDYGASLTREEIERMASAVESAQEKLRAEAEADGRNWLTGRFEKKKQSF